MRNLIQYLFIKGCRLNTYLRNKGLTLKYSDQVIKNINFIDDKCLDIYYPKVKKDKYKVIINVHGGGWVCGDKEDYQFFCDFLAQDDFCVISFDYHLANEIKYPQALIDLDKLLAFIAANQDKYYFDVDEVYAIGDSAGAQILSQYLCINSNSEYRKLFNFDDYHIKIKKACLCCGVYNIYQPKWIENILLKDYLVDDNTLDFFPFLTSNYPSVKIITSEHDFLKRRAYPFYIKLKRINVDCEYYKYRDDFKLLPHVFHLNLKKKIARKCNQDIIEYFKS